MHQQDVMLDAEVYCRLEELVGRLHGTGVVWIVEEEYLSTASRKWQASGDALLSPFIWSFCQVV